MAKRYIGICYVSKYFYYYFTILQPEEVFASFEAEPLGTASLAQVHRATLHSGEVEMELLSSWS